jgi:hypothetical protein
MQKNSNIYILLIVIGIGVYLISLLISAISFLIVPLGIIALIGGALLVSYLIYSHLYFKSDKFLDIKNSIQQYAKNCNELNSHINDLKSSFVDISTYDYGTGELNDNSNYNYKRTEWKNNIKHHQTYNCSSAVLKSASNQPIKYLCKYFNIETNESTFSNLENVLNNFAAAEQGKTLLKNERDLILDNISGSIPKLIMYFSKNKLVQKLGFENFDFSDLYFPVYTFQYVSAGGNSSSKLDVKLNVENLERLVSHLNDLIKFRKSAEGQRALMTSVLREKIKTRDNFACRKCSLSIKDERNLLLEIDHIIPISKGGITSENNLQTLCWRCNRSKGSKIESVSTNIADAIAN